MNPEMEKNLSSKDKKMMQINLVENQVDVSKLQTEKLHRLLRTPEEEADTRRSLEGKLPELHKIAKDGTELFVFGTRHIDTLEKKPVESSASDEVRAEREEHNRAVDTLIKAVNTLRMIDPDITIVEGAMPEAAFPDASLEEILKKDPEDVLRSNQEQAAVALIAKQRGKEVRSWDMTALDQIRFILNLKNAKTGKAKYQSGDVAGWYVLYATRMVYKTGKRISPDEIRKLAEVSLTPKGVEEARGLGIDLTDDVIEAVLQKYTNNSSSELAARMDELETKQKDAARLIEMTEPHYGGKHYVTSGIPRDMNIARDQHAIDVIAKAKQDAPGKKIFVISGGSHVTTWEPALKELFK